MKTRLTKIRSWKKFQLSLFSKGMLYAMSSGLHLMGFMLYFIFLANYTTQQCHLGVCTTVYFAPFGYYNPTLWNSFYIFYTFVAIFFFYHGCRVLYKFFRALPDYAEELDTRGYETERIDRT